MRTVIDGALEEAANAVEDVIGCGVQKAMNLYNRKVKEVEDGADEEA